MVTVEQLIEKLRGMPQTALLQVTCQEDCADYPLLINEILVDYGSGLVLLQIMNENLDPD